MHRRPQDYAFFKQLQPTVFKIMDGGDNDYAWARANLPNSLIIARDWALSEQHDDMRRDPTGTGQRHAAEWNQHQQRLGFDKSRTLILGTNEPKIWDAGIPEALRLYTIALCDSATQLGLRVGAMQLSVGWPNNRGAETLPDWSPWHGVEIAIRRNGGALVCHEYWADQGPGENWGWWAGRVLKCPWQVPIVIGETGIDMYVKDGSVSKHARGWHSRKSPEQYAAELADYVGRMSNDSRFAGCAVFAADFASQEWFSFDIEPAYQAILATPIVDPPKPEQPPKPENPPKPEPPIGETPPVFPVGNAPLWPVRGPVTQRWGERPEFYQKALNIPCHNGVDIGIAIGSPIIAPADGVVKWVDNDPAGYGLYLRVFLPAFRVHVFLAHLDKCLVQAGDVVKRGQVIAHSGNSGMSDGPHCHIEMRLGTEHSYAAGTFGHGNGRVDPQAVFWLLGGVQEPMAGPSQ